MLFLLQKNQQKKKIDQLMRGESPFLFYCDMSQHLTIEPQKKRSRRINLFLDDQFFIGLDLEIASELNLKNGMMIGDSTINEIRMASEYDKAKTFVLRSLSKTDQPKSAIEKKLKSKLISDNVIQRILKECESNNYINDERYTRSFVHDKVKFLHWGKLKIRTELTKKGIEKKLIDVCLSQVDFPEETDGILLEKILKKYKPLSDLKNQQKAIRYLQYRGFSWDEINRILKDKKTLELE